MFKYSTKRNQEEIKKVNSGNSILKYVVIHESFGGMGTEIISA
jgi:hypothetical protein